MCIICPHIAIYSPPCIFDGASICVLYAMCIVYKKALLEYGRIFFSHGIKKCPHIESI